MEPACFQPRVGLLAELDRAGARVPVVHVVTGPPGVGKTTLAAAYARAKLAESWRLVAWINARDEGTLLAGLARTADAAGWYQGEAGRDTPDSVGLLRRQLEADGDHCLVVFDDARDPELLKPFVRACGKARVLITGLGPSPAIQRTSVPVDVFSDDEALAFLTQRTGRVDDEGAAALAAELGHLPLVLAQAAAVIAVRSLGYRAYLELLRAAPVDDSLIREVGQPSGPGVPQAVLLALEAVRADDHAGTCNRVIEIVAVLSAAGVRRDLLHAAGQAGALANGRYRVAADQVDDALARLAERSLLTISMDGQTVLMHPVVALVVRAELDRRQLLAAVCRAAASVLEARARVLDPSRDRLAVRDIPEQVSALLDSTAGQVGDGDRELAMILLRLRFVSLYYLIELGDSAPQAVAVGEPLIADLERVAGPLHPQTLNARNSLAAAYQAAGRSGEAITMFERTLVGRQRLLGPDHPDTLTSQNNLATAYQDEGRAAEAILLFELTLATRERLLGADHPSTLNSRGNLAAAYRDVGRVAEAILLFEQTLAARERVLGPDHPDTLRSRNNLAAARRAAGENPPLPETAPAEEEVRPAEVAAEAPPVPEMPPTAEEPPVPETVPAEEEVRPAVVAAEAPPVPEQDQRPADARYLPPGPSQSPPYDPVEQPPDLAEIQYLDDQERAEEALDLVSEAARHPGTEGSASEPSATPGGRSDGRSSRPRRVRILGLAVAILILLAGGVTVAVARSHVASRPSGGSATPALGPVQVAAGWISRYVSRSAIVACDPVMCAALEARGVTAANLLVLRTSAASPLAAQVVVSTHTLRSQFGGRLDSVYAPLVMASFGSGPGEVSVQVVAPQGAAAYLAALGQDVAARKAAGVQLLANTRIAVTAQARPQLEAGNVDSRLLILLPALAAEHPIQILAFGDPGPGASPGVPWCSADLSGSVRAAGMAGAGYVSWLTAFVRAQLLPFAGSISTLRQDGQIIVRIEFARPSPLGLLTRGAI